MSNHPEELSLHVVIATNGLNAHLEATLNALQECPKPKSFKHIWVIENNPKPNYAKLLREPYCSNKIIYKTLSYFSKSGALNYALDEIKDGLIYFLDDDVIPNSSNLLLLDEIAREKGSEYFFGGPLQVDRRIKAPRGMRDFLPLSVIGWDPGYRSTHILEKNNFLGANWACFSQNLKSINGFDLRAGPIEACTGEETRAQRQLIKKGLLPLYCPELIVTHQVRREKYRPKYVLNLLYRRGFHLGYYFDPFSNQIKVLFKLPFMLAYLAISTKLPTRWMGMNLKLSQLCRYSSYRGMLMGLFKKILEIVNIKN